jgi:amidophosphoribosyltransferase
MNNCSSALDMPDRKEKCGVFGIYGDPLAVEKCYLGMHALQHRGQESAGIAVSNGTHIQGHTGMGLVSDVFTSRVLKEMKGKGDVAIGHVRYSTSGSSCAQNAQPLMAEYSQGQVALAHNGNLINADQLRREYEEHGHIFQGSSDTEVIIHLLAKPTHASKSDPLPHVLDHLQGAYSLLFLFKDRMEAARDPHGIRPLCIGKTEAGAWVIASESCALDILDANYIRDVEPGEIITIDKDGMSSRFFGSKEVTPAHCIFEQVYFSDPSSRIFGENVHQVRMEMGRQLARESAVDADLVVPVPNCARCAADGYAEESGIARGRGFTVSHYIGRSFIQPDQSMRDLSVKMKLNVIREVVDGKRLIVVEDSVVRGTTTRGKMGALRKAGAKEIHLRVASPPVKHACYYGIDFPDEEKLIANNKNLDEIRDYLEIDSIAYLSLEGMLKCVKYPPEHYCNACWSGNYPLPINATMGKFDLERYQLKMFE